MREYFGTVAIMMSFLVAFIVIVRFIQGETSRSTTSVAMAYQLHPNFISGVTPVPGKPGFCYVLNNNGTAQKGQCIKM